MIWRDQLLIHLSHRQMMENYSRRQRGSISMHKRRSWHAFFIAMGRAKSDKHEAALHLSCRKAGQYSATSRNVGI